MLAFRFKRLLADISTARTAVLKKSIIIQANTNDIIGQQLWDKLTFNDMLSTRYICKFSTQKFNSSKNTHSTKSEDDQKGNNRLFKKSNERKGQIKTGNQTVQKPFKRNSNNSQDQKPDQFHQKPSNIEIPIQQESQKPKIPPKRTFLKPQNKNPSKSSQGTFLFAQKSGFKESTTFKKKGWEQSEVDSSAYNLRTCQMIMQKFKDIAKQSTNVRDIISNFYRHKKMLIDNKVEQTKLCDSYEGVLYANAIRSFCRIIRRNNTADKQAMIGFLGNDYQMLKNVNINSLSQLQISDFISLFFQFEIYGKYKFVSTEKRNIFDKFLGRLREKMKEHKIKETSQWNERQLLDPVRAQKRYVSSLILASRAAQFFGSQLASNFLNLLQEYITEGILTQFRAVAIVKFLLRQQTTNHMEKELEIFKKLLKKIEQIDLLQKFDAVTLRQFYINVSTIVRRNSKLFNFTFINHFMELLQQTIISRLPNIPVSEISIICSYLAKFPGFENNSMVKTVYRYLFDSINEKGECALSPLFVIVMVSALEKCHSSFISKLDPKWQDKLVNMYNKYLVSKESPNMVNLQPYSQYLKLIVQSDISKKLTTTIVESWDLENPSSIIPYPAESFVLQNHYLKNCDNEGIAASILRLKSARSEQERTSKLFQNQFITLEAKLPKELFDNALKQKPIYTTKSPETKLNRQGYLKTLCRYCAYFNSPKLIEQIILQAIEKIYQEFRPSGKNSPPYKRNDFLNNYKFRSRINGILFNLVLIMSQKQNQVHGKEGLGSVIRKNIQGSQFWKLVKEKDELRETFVEVLVMKETGTIIQYSQNPTFFGFLLQALKQVMGLDLNISILQTNKKLEPVLYQMLKNYDVEALSVVVIHGQFNSVINHFIDRIKDEKCYMKSDLILIRKKLQIAQQNRMQKTGQFQKIYQST